MTCSESRLAVEIIPHARHVEDRTLAAEGAHHHLVRIGQNADVVRVVLADHQVAAGAVAAVDEGMADLLPGGKADVVAGLHNMALVSKQQRHLAFDDEGMLLLQQVIVPGCAANPGRWPLDSSEERRVGKESVST